MAEPPRDDLPLRHNVGDVAARVLARLGALEGQVTRATHDTLRAHGERWKSAMVDRFQPWTPGFRHSGNSAIRRRSSALLRSMSAQLYGSTLADMRLVESAGGTEAAPHAPLQEFGGSITPKRGKWLAIPTEEALTGSGIPRRGYESPRNVPDLFFFQTNRDVASNRAWLVRRKDFRRGPTYLESETPRQVRGARRKPAKLEFLYLLIKSATVPPRLGMRETENRLAPERVVDFYSWLRRAMAAPPPGPGGAAPAPSGA